MHWRDNFIGALKLQDATFAALRDRSDVFQRGFSVLLVAALFAGLFASLQTALRVGTIGLSEDQVIAQAQQSFDQSYRGPAELRATFETYTTELTAMIYEVLSLPPRAGEAARPIAAVLAYIGGVLAHPFTWDFVGWMLFGGLVFQFAARLLGGRASMAQMLGLTALAAAPQVFTAITSILGLIATLSGVGAFGSANGLIGFVLAIWSAAIYVKATAVAQGFTTGRALEAIILGYVFLFGSFVVLFLLFIVLIALLVISLSSQRG